MTVVDLSHYLRSKNFETALSGTAGVRVDCLNEPSVFRLRIDLTHAGLEWDYRFVPGTREKSAIVDRGPGELALPRDIHEDRSKKPFRIFRFKVQTSRTESKYLHFREWIDCHLAWGRLAIDGFDCSAVDEVPIAAYDPGVNFDRRKGTPKIHSTKRFLEDELRGGS